MSTSPDLSAEARSLLAPIAVTRRTILVSSLAAGFAVAVQPVSAQTISTDAAGLLAGEVRIPVEGGEMPAYRARPETGSRLPTVLVVQEIFGVHEHIRDLCRRLAKQGYLAIAPELYARQGNVSGMSDIKQILDEVVAKVPDAQVMSDLDAALAWAAANDGDPRRSAVTGFCWGGRITWLHAAHNPQLRAGVAWYGRLVGEPTALQPKSPVDLAAELKAPVLGLYGGQDQGIPLADVETMRGALKRASKPSEIKVFENAPHGFNADYRPSYRAEEAKSAWADMLAWFRAHGV